MYIVLWKGKTNAKWQDREAIVDTYADAEIVVKAAKLKDGGLFDYAIVEAELVVYQTPEEIDAKLGVF